jgi:hypothetical protein
MMLDDFREQASDSDYFDDEEDTFDFEDQEITYTSRREFLGMTAPQRFVIAVMLLFMTCILSTFCLLVTERVVLPGF